MARNFNAYNYVDTRIVSSWLHGIPSDAGGGSEATLIAPSVCAPSAPRQRKDQPRAAPSPPATPPYTNRPHHHARFLASHLLPISRVLSFDETVAYLNEAIAARLAGVLARGGGGDSARGVARTFPTLDDFDVVRAVAEGRRRVLEGVFVAAD
ncbi:4e640afd-b039-48fa-a279-2a25650c8807 [Thermothielavioides terrestris]|uniref:4e640afd-b039-48fa-a279-2a25650c8807 n=1 Tax=Thermothielavioides terrestris TaxID=2587410 RepID=A0A3S4B337_9PEZI|nr:4e640afd-b039-48fa-a279-2a25650c8807 [Thermothielavioides terrestris]